MNKIAISLALVAVCVGVVAANKFGHRHNKHHSQDDDDYTLEHNHFSHNPRYHSGYEGSSCEDECNYHYHGKHSHHEHGHHGHHGHGGHGHRYRHHGRKHKNEHHHHGGSGEVVDFYPGGSGEGSSHHQHHNSFEGPFSPDRFSRKGHSHSGGSGSDSGFHFGGSGEDDSDNGHHGQHGFRKHKGKPTHRQGKRHGSKKGDNEGGFKNKDEFSFSGPESNTRLTDRKAFEAHKGFVAGERNAFDAGVSHRDSEEKEGVSKHQTLNRDKAFFRDRSTGTNDVDAFRTANDRSDDAHLSGENSKFLGASAGVSASDDKEFDHNFSAGRGSGSHSSED